MTLYAFRGTKPVIAASAFVADNAAVIGDVHLGDDSSIWFGCTVRGDVGEIRFGARTNVQDGSVVHVTGGLSSTHVGDDVTVGHMVILHGCRIGSRVLVGMGSTVLDNAVVGDECLVAAGSLVTPRTVIPPRSFVMGRPARVVRPVKDDELAMIVSSAHHYVENARVFRGTDVIRL
ncbi:MAG: gamma carbonic anhydrase family protein [Polyangiaceae bacterium]